MRRHWFNNQKVLLLSPVLIALVFIIACGGSATPTTAPVATSPPPATDIPATATTGEVSLPTTVPQVVAITPPVAETAVHPGKVVMVMPTLGNERWDPIHSQGGTTTIIRPLNAILIAGNPEAQMIPGIANKWEVSADGSTWTFEFDILKNGVVKFHDGSPVTTEDVVWSWKHSLDQGVVEHGTSTYLPDQALSIDSIEQTGPYQMTIVHNIVDTGFALIRASELGASTTGIIPKRPVLYDTAAELAYDKNPQGSGHMKFVSHAQSESVTLERFDDFYYHPDNGFPEDRRMKFRTLEVVIVPEPATRASAIKAGDADVGIVSLESIDQIESGGGRIIYGPEGVYWWVQFPQNWATGPTADYPNWKVSPFGQKNVRKALAYAIDKELMMERLYGGSKVAVAKGWAQVTPTTLGYSEDLDPLPYDPDLARQMLADAGYPNGEGFGKVIVNTWNSPTLPFLPESAQVAADYWRKELNLDVEVRVGESASTRQAFRAGDIQGQIVWRENETKTDGMGSTRFYYGLPGPVMPFHQDPALFKLTADVMAVVEPVARVKAINDLYKVLWEEHHAIGIGYVNIPWGAGPRILDWKPWPRQNWPSGRHTMTLVPGS